MLTLNRVSRAELEAQAHEQYRRLMGVQPGERVPVPAPDVVNGIEAATIGDAAGFWYRGRRFVLPPIPYSDGLRLHEMTLRIAQASDMESIEDTMREAVEAFARLASPASVVRFVPRRLRPNPFRKASEREIGQLLDFFWMRRTGQSFQSWVSSQVGRAKPRR